jgi:lysophospholipase L1-like esterase
MAVVVIHPAYRWSSRHECLLTRFCAENGVPMFEAYDALHPAEPAPERMFRDFMHPSAAGHRALAEGLSPFILDLLK